jgi:hypothetical protein
MSTLLIRHAECAASFDDARRELRGASGLRRLELEPRFGREFGAVRVHTTPRPPNLRPQSIDPAEVIAIRPFADRRNCSTYPNGVNGVGQLC